MTAVYKVLAQSIPTQNTLTAVYSVPTGNTAVISTISVCNQSSINNASYRIAVQKNNAAISSNAYIIFDASVLSLDTAFLTLGITMGSNDVLSANITSGNSNVSINVFGSEMF